MDQNIEMPSRVTLKSLSNTQDLEIYQRRQFCSQKKTHPTEVQPDWLQLWAKKQIRTHPIIPAPCPLNSIKDSTTHPSGPMPLSVPGLFPLLESE